MVTNAPGGGTAASAWRPMRQETNARYSATSTTAAAMATTTLKVAAGICLLVEHDPIVVAKAVATLDYLSRLVGDERRTEVNLSGDLWGSRRNVSEHTTYRRAAPADALRRLHDDRAVLIYGNHLPVHLRLRPWYREPRARARARRRTRR